MINVKLPALASIATLIIFSCASTNQAPGIAMTVTKSDYKYRTPADIYSIMEKSNVLYSIKQVDNLKPFNLVQQSIESYVISPYHRIKYESATTYNIIVEEPQGKIREIFTQAANELEKQNYEAVRKLYE